MEGEDSNFATNYRKILFECDGKDSSKTAEVKAKCLAQMYHGSLKFLDNQSTCMLLEDNLKKYSKFVDENHVYKDKVKKILSEAGITKPVELRSNLSKLTVKECIEPLLSCSENRDFRCPASEDVGDFEFEEFLDSLHNVKSLSNSFDPQTCGNEEIKTPKNGNMENRTTKNYGIVENRRTNNVNDSERQDTSGFKTASELLQSQNQKRYGNANSSGQSLPAATGQKRMLGMKRSVNSKFVSPLLRNNSSEEMLPKRDELPVEQDERLKHIDAKMVEQIKSEIMDSRSTVTWSDIAGLEFAKSVIQEAIIWPMLRPDIFTGLRRPPKGILLFGPPGTGKTLIGKCVASQSKSTFFSISASSVMSKWIGDGEKMVRALFAVARCHQPAVIFIDEVDSLLKQRGSDEHECSRRIKTEFLVQLDGAATDNEERLLIIGATNRPQELDEAARRRFVKRLYIPLPEFAARKELIQRLITNEKNILSDDNYVQIAVKSDGYSGADIKNLCSEASLGPIRAINISMIEKIKVEDVRALAMEDFDDAFMRVTSSVSPKDLDEYVAWNSTYGSGSGC